MKKLELILVAIVIMGLSFPLMYLGMLLGTGNAKLVFKGDLARKIEIDNQARVEKESKQADSLSAASSESFLASVEEKKKLELEREKLVQEQGRLEALKAELEEERKRMEKERESYEKTATAKNDAEQERLKKLARVYGSMKANEGARIMETLDDQLCINIFKYMNEDRQKAKILAAMSGDKAARLSKMMSKK